MPSKADQSATSGPQNIEELTNRYRELDRRKTQAETKLEGARSHLADLQRQAREKYDTDDIAALRKLLEKMTAENEAKRSQYQADLDRIEADLAAVEEKFAASETATGSDEAKS
jgi:septation ring formation regulator EzrA